MSRGLAGGGAAASSRNYQTLRWWQMGARPPTAAPARVVERVQQYIPLRYLKKERAADILASRRDTAKVRFTPGPYEYTGFSYEPEPSILDNLGALNVRNITNADVAGESDTLKARLAFLTWLQRNHPEVFAAAIKQAESGQLDGIMDTITGAIGKIDFTKLSEGITKAGTAYLGYSAQKDILKLNLQRANQGLPPVDQAAYGSPMIRTEIDLQPELAARLRDSMTTPLLLAGAALAAYLILRK